MSMSPDLTKVKEFYASRTLLFAQTSLPTLFHSNSYRRKVTTGTTKEVTTSSQDKTIQSCVFCRNSMVNKSSTMFQCKASTQCQSQAAFPSISVERAESRADILDHHRKETPSCGTFEWVIQAH